MSELAMPFHTAGGYRDKITGFLGYSPAFLTNAKTALTLQDPSQANIMAAFPEIELVVANCHLNESLQGLMASKKGSFPQINYVASSQHQYNIGLKPLPEITRERKKKWSSRRLRYEEAQYRQRLLFRRIAIPSEVRGSLGCVSRRVAEFLRASTNGNIGLESINMTFGTKESDQIGGFHREPSGRQQYERREAFAVLSGRPLVFAPGARNAQEAMSGDRFELLAGSMAVYRGETPDDRGAFHGNNWGGHTRFKAAAYIPLAA